MVELGDKVKESISGATGIVVARTVWLTGCVRISVQIGVNKEKGESIILCEDEERWKVISKGAYHKAQQGTAAAGPTPRVTKAPRVK